MVGKNNRTGALELSIGTIVVIVLAMSMLILGLVLVRNIFKSANSSVGALDDQVMGEIVNLFGQDNGNLIIKLGSSNSAKVKPGETFNVAVAAQHPDGNAVDRDSLEYRVELSDDSDKNCLRILGRSRAEGLIKTHINTWNSFDKFSGSTAAALLEISVPEGTPQCTQKINVDMRVKGSATANDGDAFILEIVKKGILG